MRWHRTMISIVVAMAFVFLSHAPSAFAVDVSSANGVVTISGSFFKKGYAPNCTISPEIDIAWRVHQPDSCTGRNGGFGENFKAKGAGFFHFQIVSADDLCLLLDSRLTGTDIALDEYNSFEFTLPIDEMLTSSGFTFATGSDYDQAIFPATQNDNFKLLPGEEYIFVVVENIDLCLTSDDGEDVKESKTFPIPCCFGPTGNVDFDPDDNVNIADLTFLVDHLYINNPPLPCFDEADVNQDSSVDSLDVDRLIDFLYITFDPLADCP